MLNKYSSLFAKDAYLRNKAVLMLLVFISILVLLRINKLIQARIEKLKNETEIINLIPKMEIEVKYLESQNITTQDVDTKIDKIIVNGVFIKNNVSFALIKGGFFKEGQYVQGYLVTKILPHSVILENLLTKEKVECRISE